MAKRQHTPDMIEGFESGAERLARWIGENALLAGGLLFTVLAMAGGWGGYTSLQKSREAKASLALEQIRGDYLRDMGARPGDIEFPELANPATAVPGRGGAASGQRGGDAGAVRGGRDPGCTGS